MQTLLNWPLIFVGLLNFLVAVLILARAPRKLLNISFFVSALSCAAWVFGIAGFYATHDAYQAINWAKFYYTAPLTLVLACTVLADLFPISRKTSRWRFLLLLTWLVAICVPLLTNHTYLTERIVYHDWGKEVVLNHGAYLEYIAYIIVCFVSIFTSIYHATRRESGIYRLQAQIFSIGVTLSAIFGTTFNLFLPLFGNYRLIWIGPIMTSSYVFTTSYSIFKHRLFDIRLVIARSMGYAASVLVLATIYGILLFGVGNLLFNLHLPIHIQFFFSAATAVVGLSFQKLKTSFDKITIKLFYHDAYDSQELFSELNKQLVSTVSLNLLLKHCSTVIADTLRSDYVIFGLREANSARLIGTKNLMFSSEDIALVRQKTVHFHQSVIAADLLESTDHLLKEAMDRNKVAVLVRLSLHPTKNEEGIGYLILGPKKSGNPYTNQDFNVLDTISKELIIAIQNAFRYEEIEQFNLTLQSKVDVATRKLRQTNEKLKALDEAKDDFISMASHQLRTPLTAIKGYSSMLLEGVAGDPLNKTEEQFLRQTFNSSQRMVGLVADLLNLSRLKTGKFVVERVPCNMVDVIEEELQQLQEIATSRDVSLSFEKPDHFPTVNLDVVKTHQVIMNFIDNAIYYNRQGGHIVVKLEETKDDVICTINDDGIGVPDDQKAGLFTKFYRADNAQKARPDGTGIGLFMAKKAIEAQGGQLIFKSTYNVGSTFGFKLSKTELSTAESNQA